MPSDPYRLWEPERSPWSGFILLAVLGFAGWAAAFTIGWAAYRLWSWATMSVCL